VRGKSLDPRVSFRRIPLSPGPPPRQGEEGVSAGQKRVENDRRETGWIGLAQAIWNFFTPRRRVREGLRQKRWPRDERSRNGIVRHAAGSPVCL
jgi:hypothetical protein